MEVAALAEPADERAVSDRVGGATVALHFGHEPRGLVGPAVGAERLDQGRVGDRAGLAAFLPHIPQQLVPVLDLPCRGVASQQRVVHDEVERQTGLPDLHEHMLGLGELAGQAPAVEQAGEVLQRRREAIAHVLEEGGGVLDAAVLAERVEEAAESALVRLAAVLGHFVEHLDSLADHSCFGKAAHEGDEDLRGDEGGVHAAHFVDEGPGSAEVAHLG